MTYTSFNGHTTIPGSPMRTFDPNTHVYQQPQYPYQYQYQQPSQPVMTSSHPYPIPPYATTPTPDNKYTLTTTTTTPISPVHTPSPVLFPAAHANRLLSIERICALQSASGSWTYSPELASLVLHWSGREMRRPGPDGGERTSTLAAHDCLRDLCGYVWAAQAARAEGERLTPEELARFGELGWDLGFAKGAMERAVRWAGRG